jgi:hypothetical protein
MTTYRGQDGFLALGGVLSGQPAVRLTGALSAGATSLGLNSATTLVGVLAVGDTFTIAGEAGSPVHTVTGGPFYPAVANAIAGVTFTPAIAAGGVAANAVVTVASRAIVNARLWNLTATVETLDSTTLGAAWQVVQGGEAGWSGSCEFFLDRTDPVQVALLDAAATGASVPVVTFGVQVGTPAAAAAKFVYAGATLSGWSVGATRGALVAVTATLTGTGPLLPQWA